MSFCDSCLNFAAFCNLYATIFHVLQRGRERGLNPYPPPLTQFNIHIKNKEASLSPWSLIFEFRNPFSSEGTTFELRMPQFDELIHSKTGAIDSAVVFARKTNLRYKNIR